jgi:hypothetical protein
MLILLAAVAVGLLGRRNRPIIGGASPAVLSPASTFAVRGAWLGFLLFLLVEIIRSFADSHGQLLAICYEVTSTIGREATVGARDDLVPEVREKPDVAGRLNDDSDARLRAFTCSSRLMPDSGTLHRSCSREREAERVENFQRSARSGQVRLSEWRSLTRADRPLHLTS